jgi:PHD/YefM family antitoxin component YafN of YafNO toxin-antitoxin module
MSDHIPALDLNKARQDLVDLFHQVTENHKRIEIQDGNAQDACVIISKSELESLEKALEILADSDGVKELTATFAQLATRA